MKHKYSDFVYKVIIVLSFFALDFWRIIPISFGEYNIPILVSFACLFLGMISIHYIHTFNKNVITYILIINTILTISLFNQTISLGYSIEENIKTIIPYLYSYLVIPIDYYIRTKSLDKLLNTISKISLIILLIKILGWVLYTYAGITVFSNLILKYALWVRNSTLRIELDCFFGIAFCYYLSKLMIKKSLLYNVIPLLYLLYALIISQSRTIVVIMILSSIVMMIVKKDKAEKKVLLMISLSILGVLVILSKPFANFINSFSVSNSVYGGSTIARFDCALHYWNLMKSRNAWLGLGLLDTSCEHAVNLMNNMYFSMGYWYDYYYLADIGILGGFVRFGLLSLLLYLFLFKLVIISSIKAIKNSSINTHFVVGIGIFFLMECCLLNSFELTRAFAVPFYFSILNYYEYYYLELQISKKDINKKRMRL